MSDSAEHRVAAFHAAQRQRHAGRPIWEYTIEIKDLIKGAQDQPTVVQTVEIAHEIARRVRAKLPSGMFDITNEAYERDLDEAIEIMESMTVAEFEGDDDAAMAEFNGQLCALYDWADLVGRVWLG